MDDLKSKVNDVCEVSKAVLSCLKSEIASGVMNADTKEVGEVADIIKDLSETEKNYYEAKYYKLVAEAMEEKSEFPYEMGYMPTRSTASPHWSQTGNSRSYGFNPVMEQEPYLDAYMEDRRRGSDPEYGIHYNEWRDARKHYTETHNQSDKARMDMHAKDHLEQCIDTMTDIWEDASPEMQTKMKADVKRLYDSMMMS